MGGPHLARVAEEIQVWCSAGFVPTGVEWRQAKATWDSQWNKWNGETAVKA